MINNRINTIFIELYILLEVVFYVAIINVLLCKVKIIKLYFLKVQINGLKLDRSS